MRTDYNASIIGKPDWEPSLITTITEDGEEKHLGQVKGPFGIHYAIYHRDHEPGDPYTVTHLPTGYRISDAPTLEHAERLADALLPICDWMADPDTWLTDPQVKERVRFAADMAWEEDRKV